MLEGKVGGIMENGELKEFVHGYRKQTHKQTETNKQKLDLQRNLVSTLLEIAWSYLDIYAVELSESSDPFWGH